MPAPVQTLGSPAYPHVIRRKGRRNERWSVEFVADPNEADAGTGYRFDPHEVLGAAGRPTDAGRETIVRRLVERARRTGADLCIVWGPRDCTWIDDRGRTSEGNRPPTGEVVQNHLLDRFDAVLEDVWTIRLPEGCSASHLCLRRIGANLVEITPGEPVVLGSFFDLPRPGRHDPAATMRSGRGLKAPARFRGQPVTGVRDRWEILGPVQPSADGAILRDPWPEDVRRACDRVAGRALPGRLHRAAWTALNPANAGMIHVGVLRAA